MPVQTLFLSYDGLADPLGQSQILPYLKGIAHNGYTIHIVTPEKNISPEKAECIKSELEKYNIKWYYFNYHKKPPVISTILDIFIMKRITRKIIRENNIGLIHCRGYITGLLGNYYRKKKKIPFVFDMRGFFADERKESGNWNMKNPVYSMIYKWFKKKEILFFSNADFIISLTNKGKNIITKDILHKNMNNIEIIPCCTDLMKFNLTLANPEHREEIRKKLNIPGNAVVFTYLGSAGTWYMLPEMMDFFVAISRDVPGSIFLFITNDTPAMIWKAVEGKKHDAGKYRIISLPSDKVPEYISVSDWGLFFIKPVFSKQASSPTKFAEFLAMGVPVIVNKGVGDVDEVVTNENAGIIVNGFTAEEYSAAINKIKNFNRKEKSFYREIAIKHFALDNGVKKYAEVYRRVINSL